MAMDFIGLSVGMGYTDETVIGGGALKGKNCVVSNIEEVADGVNVTFQWTLDNGTVQTETVLLPKGTQGEAGVAGKSAYEIWLEAGNTGTEEDFLNSLKGEQGEDGFSPVVTVTDIEGGHNVAIEDANGVQNFEVLDGKDGVQISDNETVEDKTWSSKKTSDEIAEVETELNAKVDKTDIATTIDLSSTDEQVASAKAVYDGLENINDFSVQVVKENLDLNDITETGIYYFSQTYTPVNIPMGVNGWLLVMKGSSSDIVKQVWYRQGTADINSYNTFERYKAGDTWSEWTRFLTEKDYYSALNSGNTSIPQNADLNDYLTPGVYACTDGTIAKTLANCPHIDSNFKLIVNKNRGNSDIFYGYQMIVGTVGGNPVKDVCIYYRGVTTSSDGVSAFSKWKIMSGSTVADVPKTTLTPVFPSGVKVASAGVAIYYIVRNGWCNVNFVFHLSSATTFEWTEIATGLPKPANNVNMVLINAGGEISRTIFAKIDSTGSVSSKVPVEIGTADWWTCNISYPVAES